MWLDTKDGPLVIETQPNILGMIDDHWFEYVGDVGNAGPRQGQGRKIPAPAARLRGRDPGRLFRVPDGDRRKPVFSGAASSKTASTATAVENTRKFAKVYPLSEADNPPPMTFINTSGKVFNTIHANDFHFYEEVNDIVQYEPNEGLSPRGSWAARGDRHREGQALSRPTTADEEAALPKPLRSVTPRRAPSPSGHA